jgi:hypothetical protein
MNIHEIDKVGALQQVRDQMKANAKQIPCDLKMSHLRAKRGELTILGLISMLDKYGSDLFTIEVRTAQT